MPFPVSTALTAIAIAYKPQGLIADQVLPRKEVAKKKFQWTEYAPGQFMQVPDTRVGRRSRPNEVDFSGTERTAECIDYGLDHPLSYDENDNAIDPQLSQQIVQYLTGIVHQVRELRVAALVQSATNYDATAVVPLSGASMWTDPSSDPIANLLDMLERPLVRPNTLVFNVPTWLALRTNPKARAQVYGSGSDKLLEREHVAAALEVDRVLVGAARVETSRNPGVSVKSRCWGNHVAGLYLNPDATPQFGMTFGWTAFWGAPVAGSQPENTIGLRGGERFRSGESLIETIAAKSCGFLLQNVA